jgi:hypothetical protein
MSPRRRGETSNSRRISGADWAYSSRDKNRPRTLLAWRSESQMVGFVFVLAEMIESALPLRLPILSALLGCVLQGPFELREARRRRRAGRGPPAARAAHDDKAMNAAGLGCDPGTSSARVSLRETGANEVSRDGPSNDRAKWGRGRL